MSSEKKFFSPELYPLSGERFTGHQSRYFIKYYIKDFTAGKLIPKKYYGVLNQYPSYEQLKSAAEKIIADMNRGIAPPPYRGKRKIPRPSDPAPQWFSVEKVLNDALSKREFTIQTKSYIDYKCRLQLFLDYIIQALPAGMPIGAITADHCRDFVRHLVKKGYASRTINDTRHLLCGLWKSISQKVPVNPWLQVPHIRQIDKDVFIPHPDWLQQLIMDKMPMFDSWLMLHYMMTYACFIRSTELRTTRISQIDFRKGSIRVYSAGAKNGKTRTVVLPIWVLQYMIKLGVNTYPDHYFLFGNGEPSPTTYSINYFRNRWNQFKERFGIGKEYKLYAAKHTGNLQLADTNIHLYKQQLQNGHSSTKQLEHYLKKMKLQDSDELRHFPKPGEIAQPSDLSDEIQRLREQINLLIDSMNQKRTD